MESERAEGQVAAFFDLDRTLIPFNSAMAYARHEYRARRRSYFYTDSYSDLAMLEAVEGPRVVNPDPRLRRFARRRGWPVELWAR